MASFRLSMSSSPPAEAAVMRAICIVLALSFAGNAFAQTTQTAAAWKPGVFPISYWCGPPEKFTDLDRFREIKEANFTYVMPPCGLVNPDLNHQILDLAQQVGLKAFIQDPQMPLAMTGSYKARPDMDAIVKDY